MKELNGYVKILRNWAAWPGRLVISAAGGGGASEGSALGTLAGASG